MKGADLTTALAIGTTVYCRTAYSNMPHGTNGEVTGYNDETGSVVCRFLGADYEFNHDELLTTEQEQARKAEQEQQRLEQQRLEQQRLEQQRLEQQRLQFQFNISQQTNNVQYQYPSASYSQPTAGRKYYKGGQFMPGGGRAPAGGAWR